MEELASFVKLSDENIEAKFSKVSLENFKSNKRFTNTNINKEHT